MWQNADSCFSSMWHIQHALDFKHLHFFEVLTLLEFKKILKYEKILVKSPNEFRITISDSHRHEMSVT